MSQYLFKAEDSHLYTETIKHHHDQTLAEEFGAQVEAFYSLPRPDYKRTEIVFSPSGVTKCARELYYINTNAPQDTQPLVPWKERNARNGTGSHDATQSDYLIMEQKLREHGIVPKFRFLEAEIKGERTFQVGKYKVKIRGRSDGRIGVLDERGNVIESLVGKRKPRTSGRTSTRLSKKVSRRTNTDYKPLHMR